VCNLDAEAREIQPDVDKLKVFSLLIKVKNCYETKSVLILIDR